MNARLAFEALARILAGRIGNEVIADFEKEKPALYSTHTAGCGQGTGEGTN